MKHRIWLLTLGLAMGLPLQGADWQATPEGRTRFGEYEFFVAHWSKGWAYREQSAQTVNFPEKAASSEQGMRRTGTFKAAAGNFRFTEIRKDADGKLTLSYELSSDTPVPTENLALMTRMTGAAMLQKPLTLNGKALSFPKVADKTKAFIEHKVSAKDLLVLPTSVGDLEIRFNGRVTLEDERRFGRNAVSIRFQFYPPRSMELAKSGLTITMGFRKDGNAAAKKSAWQASPEGRTKVGEYDFFVAHWSKGWAYREQSAKTVQFPEKAVSSEQGMRRTGSFQTAAGTFRFTEIRKEADGKLTLNYELSSDTPIPTENLAWMTRMTGTAMLQKPMTFNGTPLVFPKVADKTKAFIEHKVSAKDLLVLPTSAGDLEIRFNGRVTLEDERRFGRNAVSIRFQFYPPRSMSLAKSGFTITLGVREAGSADASAAAR